VYSVAIEHAENLQQRVLRSVRSFAIAPSPMKVCESPQSDVSNCLLIAVEDILRIPCELLLGKQYELYSYWKGCVL